VKRATAVPSREAGFHTVTDDDHVGAQSFEQLRDCICSVAKYNVATRKNSIRIELVDCVFQVRPRVCFHLQYQEFVHDTPSHGCRADAIDNRDDIDNGRKR
jgi:hypothetical protein